MKAKRVISILFFAMLLCIPMCIAAYSKNLTMNMKEK